MALVALLALPQAAQAADITGTWHLPSGDVADQTWEITAGTGTIAGEGYGGSYTWPMEGNVSGNSVQIKTAYRETSYTAYFVGTVSADGNTMSGTWDTTSYATAESSSLTWHADRVTGGGGGGPGGGGSSGKRPTGTGVSCNYSFFNQRHTCFAQVQDTGTPPPVIPTGEVKFATTEGGSFPMGDTCTLVSSQTAPAVPSCSVEYIAPKAGTYFAQVGATYLGDAQHDPSSGATAYMSAAFPSDCNAFNGCGGTDIDVKKVLDLIKSLGPITIGCGAPGASAAQIGSIKLPPGTMCTTGLNGLGKVLGGAAAKIGGVVSGPEFKTALKELDLLIGKNTGLLGGPGGGGGGSGSGGFGKSIGTIVDAVSKGSGGKAFGGLGQVFSGLPDKLFSNPLFQTGVIEALFQTQFNQAAPPFPTPVTGQGSAKRKKKSFVIASGRFTVDTGKTRKVRLKLSKKARRFFKVLRRHGIGLEFPMTLQATLARGGVPGVAKGKTNVRVRLKAR